MTPAQRNGPDGGIQAADISCGDNSIIAGPLDLTTAATGKSASDDPAQFSHRAHPSEWEAAHMLNRAAIRALCGFRTTVERWPVSSFGRVYPRCPDCAEAQARIERGTR